MIGRTNARKAHVPSATINVTTSESTLIGTTCTLSFGGSVIKSAVFDSNGNCSFAGIVDAGTYTVGASDGTSSKTENVTVTQNDIDNEVALSVTISLIVPLPVASLGDIVNIGGYDCMCIGTNRYLFLTSIGVAGGDWSYYVGQCQNWGTPTAITDLYNVSSKSAPSKAEADALTVENRQTIYSRAGSKPVWTLTENPSNVNEAYDLPKIPAVASKPAILPPNT